MTEHKNLVSKPLVVWLAQASCALVAVSCLYFSKLLDTTSSSAILAALGLLYLALLIAIQKRQAWARWLIVFFFGSAAASALFQGLGALARSSDDTALLVTSAGAFLVCTLISVHFVLGEPVRNFFGSRASHPKGQGLARQNPYAPPNG